MIAPIMGKLQPWHWQKPRKCRNPNCSNQAVEDQYVLNMERSGSREEKVRSEPPALCLECVSKALVRMTIARHGPVGYAASRLFRGHDERIEAHTARVAVRVERRMKAEARLKAYLRRKATEAAEACAAEAIAKANAAAARKEKRNTQSLRRLAAIDAVIAYKSVNSDADWAEIYQSVQSPYKSWHALATAYYRFVNQSDNLDSTQNGSVVQGNS
jgi:hypothetical protein